MRNSKARRGCIGIVVGDFQETSQIRPRVDDATIAADFFGQRAEHQTQLGIETIELVAVPAVEKTQQVVRVVDVLGCGEDVGVVGEKVVGIGQL